MSKTPDQLPALTTPADNDLLIIEDVSAGATKKITRQNFLLGVPVQVAVAQFPDADTGTTTIPKDDTAPQSSEGTEFMTIDFTPRFAGSTLIIEVLFVGAYSTTDDLIAALFKDSDASSFSAAGEGGAAGALRNVKLQASVSAGGTTLRTYKVRAGGAAAGTVTFNGSAGTRLFGSGVNKSYIKVTEYAG